MTLRELCEDRLRQKGLSDERHVARLGDELKEITKQKEEEYFLDLYKRGVRYEKNEHNLLVAYLLGLAADFNIEREPEHTVPEYPDIDTDFLPTIRDYLKEEFVPKYFGEEYVCDIGSYNTYGLKSALIDMTRIFGGDRNEILNITTRIGLKDDEGEAITWDKALEIYPDLKAWTTSCLPHRGKPEKDCPLCAKQEKIAYHAKNLLAADIDWEKYDFKEPPHRNRSFGKHAAGAIVSSKRIDELVPLVRDKDGGRVSAWPEGLHSQDLSQVGLVKMDFLALDALNRISLAIKLIKERHPHIKKICSVSDDSPSWSDPSYLNDPKCLEAANRGDLKMVFQFDSDGIRSLARKGGVTSFDDLVAYTALYRPGPMDVGMHETFIKRKKGEEEYTLHPLMKEIGLGKTYGVMVYQEQVMKVLNKIGLIPEAECQPIIKAISKKQAGKFAKYKDIFIANAQKTLGYTVEQAKRYFEEIESFAGYGFNAAHSVAYTVVTARQLWLRTHYPLEYITAVMACLKTGDDRLLEYRFEARKHKVEVMPVDVNKSSDNFTIVDDKIYWGFSNVKGIGKEVAARILANKPYKDFHDFLQKFGTDGAVIKPIIGLRLFKEKEPIDIYKYYVNFKNLEKKRAERLKRFAASKDKIMAEVADLVGVPLEEAKRLTWEELQRTLEGVVRGGVLQASDAYESLSKLQRKYEKCIESYQNKMVMAEVVESEADDDDLNAELVELFLDKAKCEVSFYGFQWDHPLEKSPDFEGLTFERHREDMNAGFVCAAVDVQIVEVKECLSKKGTTYYQVDVEDACRERQKINVWKDIYSNFSDVLTQGKLVRLRLVPPSGGFRTYGIESYPRWKKVDKRNDPRVVPLRAGAA